MDSDPRADAQPGGLVERRRLIRLPVVRPVTGFAISLNEPVALQDISGGGFSVLAAFELKPGTAYEFQFPVPPHPVVVEARLVYAMRVSGNQASAYWLGLEFVDSQRDQTAIAALIAYATTGAV
jgi:hypothetical protein